MRFVGAVLFGLVVSGCKDLNEAARENFSRAHTCPMERVEARPRSEIRPSTLRFADDKPPPDLGSDPGRLQMWQDERAKDRKYQDDNFTTFEVRGCGFVELYTCMRGARNVNRAFCARYDHPPGVAKWQ